MKKTIIRLSVLVLLLAGASSIQPSVGLYWTSNADPTAGGGVAAPLWQLLIRTDTPTLYYKSGTGNTSWTSLSGGGGTTYSAGNGLALAANVFKLRTDCANGENQQWDATTSSWLCRQINDYRSKHLDWNDEFMTICGGTAPCAGVFTLTVAGTAAGAGSLNTTTRPGIMTLATGTTATGRALLSSISGIDFPSMNSATFEATVGFATLSTSTDEYGAIIGFGDVTSGLDQADGCFFVNDRAGNIPDPATGSDVVGNIWKCRAESNVIATMYPMDGTTVSDEGFTTVSQPIAAMTLPNTNIYDLKIVETTISGTPTRCEFYVNNVKSCDIATHIPTGTGRQTGLLMLMLKSVGTTNLAMAIDRTHIALDMTVARSL